MSQRTELPTRRRIEQARASGDSPNSTFFGQAVAFFAVLAVVPAAVAAASDELMRLVRAQLAQAATPTVDAGSALIATASVVTRLSVPLVAVIAVSSALASLMQTGGVFSAKKFALDASRLNVAQGLGKLLSKERALAVLRASVLAAGCAYVAFDAIVESLPRLARLAGRIELAPSLALATGMVIAKRAATLALGIGLVDLLWTRRAWLSRLRMTKEEVKREHRETDGDPELKAARERAHHEMLASAIVRNVPQANVVVVNPTHLACALRYDAERGDEAPHLVASGRGELAARIVAAARQFGIPVLQNVSLAHALVELEVGTEIPEALYEAVAEVLRAAWDES